MNYTQWVDIRQRLKDASDKKLSLHFRELPVSRDMISKITARFVIKNQIQTFLVLKRVDNIYNKRVMHDRQKLPLVFDRLNRPFRKDAGFQHEFKSVHRLWTLVCHFPDFSEASPSYGGVEVEMMLRLVGACFCVISFKVAVAHFLYIVWVKAWCQPT